MEQQVESLQQRLRQQEKLASLGMLSAGIAHEIQNPLNFVINFSKMSSKLLTDLTDIVTDNEDALPNDDREELDDIVADLKENMARIVEHGERAISIIQGILLVSRGKDNEFLPTDVARVVKEYVWLSYHAMRANYKDFNISIGEDYAQGLPQVMAIPQDLSRAVLNLMNNACYTVWKKQQHADPDYQPRIDIKVAMDSNSQPCISITIADNGEGMTPEVKERLFENFFTTKPIGEGTGLGMAITRDIIENKHGGHLSFETEEGKGTTFTLTIPIKKV
ncbi:MAG: HAMP domain-containing histidine kinase [Prevotella sp.]|nr:HAMP domain-containing histidine kinase [Prevotella sp.]